MINTLCKSLIWSIPCEKKTGVAGIIINVCQGKRCGGGGVGLAKLNVSLATLVIAALQASQFVKVTNALVHVYDLLLQHTARLAH